MNHYLFPPGFVWGASSCAYQSEGAWNVDGKGESIWDRFSHIPGNIRNNDNGDVACDFYHRYREDIALLKELSLCTQRISISWPRIFPDGNGSANIRGLDYYRRVIDTMLENGIMPFIMLYHWDLPQKLQDKGGWTNRDTAGYFSDYTDLIFRCFPDCIPYWGTILEPHVVAYNGHFYGCHAPGHRDLSSALLAAHNLLLAHGMAVKAFRDSACTGKIGIVNLLSPVYPVSDNEEDIAAAKRYNDFANNWFTDPVEMGRYPTELTEYYAKKGIVLPHIKSGDMELISQRTDYFGLNFYRSSFVGAADCWPLCLQTHNPAGRLYTAMDWPVCPDGFSDILLDSWKRYGKSIMVTENGSAFEDFVGRDGCVHDAQRLDFLREHLKAMHSAMEKGAQVEGYLAWSSFDNFEWAEGYEKRFGLVYVDYSTQKRIIKDSGKWYSNVIKNNGFSG